MALSDCIKCWSTPCTCGYDYRGWDKSRKDELVRAVQGSSLDELWDWLESKDYLTDDKNSIRSEFNSYINRKGVK